jgi:cytochrome c oxidase subunit 2
VNLEAQDWERGFLVATATVLVVLFVAILGSVVDAGIDLPADAGQIDPRKLSIADPAANPVPFNELGVVAAAEGEPVDFRVVLLAAEWRFFAGEEAGSRGAIPRIEVPAGSRAEFVLTSLDTVHGFLVADLAVNATVIPGQITRVTVDLDRPGEYRIVCHEFCGIGHHTMYGVLEVTP